MQSNNQWLNFVHDFHKKQNHLTYKEALQQAKYPYRKYQKQRGGGGGNNANNGNGGNNSNDGGSGGKCGFVFDTKRIPSYCDRIIYRSNDKQLTFSEGYKVITDDFISYSDHKMISATFDYGQKSYKLFSWNMGAFDSKAFCENVLTRQIEKFCTKYIGTFNGNYVIFGLQESVIDSYFIYMLQKIMPKFSFTLVNHVTTKGGLLSFNKKFIIQQLVFKKVGSGNNYSQEGIVGESGFTMGAAGFKSVLGHTKSFVYWTKSKDLTIVVTHLPINTKDQKIQGVLGVNLRKRALAEIIHRFQNSPQLVIMGDLNFRRELATHTNTQGQNQLTNTLKTESFLREFSEPDGKTPNMFTCRYRECDAPRPPACDDDDDDDDNDDDDMPWQSPKIAWNNTLSRGSNKTENANTRSHNNIFFRNTTNV